MSQSGSLYEYTYIIPSTFPCQISDLFIINVTRTHCINLMLFIYKVKFILYIQGSN